MTIIDSILTVKQLNILIKSKIEIPQLKNIKVEGEISKFKEDTKKGHLYFSIKDHDSKIECVWFGDSWKTKCKNIDTGSKVILTGNLNLYILNGTYNIIALDIEDVGVGNIYREFLELKNKLEKEGLFDEKYKKQIPKYARTIGIVTASPSAALEDIKKRAVNKYPGVKLVITDCYVQGALAQDSIVRAINILDNRDDIEIIIVARGGGSPEDLHCFNSEKIARAMFVAKKPIITGIGHEIDTTIADYVADLRASTPSIAIEKAIFNNKEELEILNKNYITITNIIKNIHNLNTSNFETINESLLRFNPKNQINYFKNCINIYNNTIYSNIKISSSQQEKRVDEILPSLHRNLISDKKIDIQSINSCITIETKKITSSNLHKIDVVVRDINNLNPIYRIKNITLDINSSKSHLDNYINTLIKENKVYINNILQLLNSQKTNLCSFFKDKTKQCSFIYQNIDSKTKSDILKLISDNDNLFDKIELLNPINTLDRGFAILLDLKGNSICSSSQILEDENYKLLFRDEQITIKIQIVDKTEGNLYE